MMLSLVMATLNRAKFIGETLASIVPQLGPACELIVFDGGSTDQTDVIVKNAAALCPHIRYVRGEPHLGLDHDYDVAVNHAWGTYCWLVSDDDLLVAGAVARVLELLQGEPDLIVVDSEVRDIRLERVIAPRRLKFSEMRHYGLTQTDALLHDGGDALSFIGGTIIKTSVWKARDRKQYYGSLFVHMGVIFQAPLTAIVTGEPLIILRLGNGGWSGRAFEIWMFKYPNLVWGFNASESAKRAVTPRTPWRRLKHLLSARAKGAYSTTEYRKFLRGEVGLFQRVLVSLIAVVPGHVVNCAACFAYRCLKQHKGIAAYLISHNNRYSNSVGRWIVS